MQLCFYTIEIPYRYMKKIIGRPPDEIGDDSAYYQCKVNPKWIFENHIIFNCNYQLYTNDNESDNESDNYDKDSDEYVRRVGINATFDEDINDVQICDFGDDYMGFGDDYVDSINLYNFILQFNNISTSIQKNIIIRDFINKYTILFNDIPKIKYYQNTNDIIEKVEGKYLSINLNIKK